MIELEDITEMPVNNNNSNKVDVQNQKYLMFSFENRLYKFYAYPMVLLQHQKFSQTL